MHDHTRQLRVRRLIRETLQSTFLDYVPPGFRISKDGDYLHSKRPTPITVRNTVNTRGSDHGARQVTRPSRT